ncbi:MAG: PKD domain-containing protein [Flavobacteriales bacterium]|nr:PKD domain-containing protein [Flavobacteriales bacterium]
MKKIYLLTATFFTLGFASVNAQNCLSDFYSWSTNLQAVFADSSFSTSGNHTYDWDFGDGNVSNLSNPVHNYAATGTYTVCLTITDSLCTDSICHTIVITAAPPRPCMASFTYSANSNNVVNFNSNVTGGSAPYTYSWNFGGGPASGSTAANPSYNYSTPGSYVATLTVTDVNGTSCSSYDTVNVNICSAYFSYSANSNGVVNFTNQSNPLNAASLYIDWNFGDGTANSSSIHPTHTYAASGTYTVTFNYYDSLTNCSAVYTDNVVVLIGAQNNCNASYTIAVDSSLAFGVILYNTSSNFASHSYSWDFGDGTTGSGRTPIHQYLSFGSYVVCLTITDTILNCTSTFCDTVGMDSLGNLKTGFGIRIVNPIAVGINEMEEFSAINLYPNPATNSISLDLRALDNTLNIKIVDVAGRVVLERANQKTGNIEEFEISNLNSGLYFMMLDNGVSQKIEKFIKH